MSYRTPYVNPINRKLAKSLMESYATFFFAMLGPTDPTEDRKDCWLIVDGEKYRASSFLPYLEKVGIGHGLDPGKMKRQLMAYCSDMNLGYCQWDTVVKPNAGPLYLAYINRPFAIARIIKRLGPAFTYEQVFPNRSPA